MSVASLEIEINVWWNIWGPLTKVVRENEGGTRKGGIFPLNS